jgi:4-hydroxy-3-methylbut-2-enyl diphosphate reductase
LGSSNYNRKGFKSEKEGVAGMMVQEFTSPLIAEMRANGGVVKRGDVTVKLAEYYGFCWGVERAVRTRLTDNPIICITCITQLPSL